MRCSTGGSVEFPTSAKDETILGIKADERNFLVQVKASGSINLGQYAWVEEKGGAQIEAQPVGFEARGATAQARQTFEDLDLQAGLRQQDSGGEPPWAGPDNECSLHHGVVPHELRT